MSVSRRIASAFWKTRPPSLPRLLRSRSHNSAELLHKRAPRRLVWLINLVPKDIGINHRRTALFEQLRNSRFPARDAAGQPDNQHTDRHLPVFRRPPVPEKTESRRECSLSVPAEGIIRGRVQGPAHDMLSYQSSSKGVKQHPACRCTSNQTLAAAHGQTRRTNRSPKSTDISCAGMRSALEISRGRRTSDPYAILVSEVLLQQTQVLPCYPKVPS